MDLKRNTHLCHSKIAHSSGRRSLLGLSSWPSRSLSHEAAVPRWHPSQDRHMGTHLTSFGQQEPTHVSRGMSISGSGTPSTSVCMRCTFSTNAYSSPPTLL